MKIAFLRHGHALDVFTAGVSSDSQRPLSKEGRKETENSVLKLKELGFTPSLILSSPYKRALETSAIAAKHLNCPRIETLDSLIETDADKTLNAIFSISKGNDALVVGHQPLIGLMASFCSNADNLSFPTSGFALIDFPGKENYDGKLIAAGFGGEH